MNNAHKSHRQELQVARKMRHDQTPAETALWAAIRGRQLAGLKFHRQQVIGPFIADFYDATTRLVIEIDGDIHDYQADGDGARTRLFENYGYEVLRFKNELVINSFENVLNQIKYVGFERISDLIPSHQREHDDATGSPDAWRGDSPLSMNSGVWAGG